MAAPVAVCGADQTFAQGALPTLANFNGNGSIPGTGGAAIVAWQWTILYKPPGSNAAIVNATLVNPQLQTIDTWGNYRLFLQVTDNLGAVSEANPLLAPDSAFVHVRVTATATGLQKISKGERNHQEILNAWLIELDDLRVDFAAHRIQDHDTAATGTQLTKLTNGGYATADGLVGGASLHKHGGGTVDLATLIANGVVKLAETPLDAGNPKAVTKDRFWWSGVADGTYLAGGYSPGVIAVPALTPMSQAHAALKMHEACRVMEFGASLVDGGDKSVAYMIRLYKMTAVQYRTNDFAGATVLAMLTLDPTNAHEPVAVYNDNVNQAIAKDDFLAVNVHQAPTTVAAYGSGLTFAVGFRKEW